MSRSMVVFLRVGRARRSETVPMEVELAERVELSGLEMEVERLAGDRFRAALVEPGGVTVRSSSSPVESEPLARAALEDLIRGLP